MEDTHFHVGILGTGLTESILAAALSKAGYKVVHIDENPYYGDEEASLSLDELAEWIDNHSTDLTTSRFRRASRSSTIPPSSRQYAICLCPTIFPSLGPFILSLVNSGVSKYSTFRLLDCVAVYDSSGAFKDVPGSKEEIFKSKDISLIEKRRLMRFLTFAASNFEESKELEGRCDMPFVEFLTQVFSLKDEIAATIAYSLAFSIDPFDPALAALKRLNVYMRSVGRYGPSPFLVGHYGGVGDISQGFCRAAAVNGAVYILGRKIQSLSQSSQEPPRGSGPNTSAKLTSSVRYSIKLEDVPDTITCDILISSTSHIPSKLLTKAYHASLPSLSSSDLTHAMARCILIFDKPFRKVSNSLLTEELSDGGTIPEEKSNGRLGSAVLIFPPSTVPGGSSSYGASALITGEDTLSTPENKSIVYLSLAVNASASQSQLPEAILSPYVDVLCHHFAGVDGETILPVFKAFYVEHARSKPALNDSIAVDCVVPSCLVPAELPLAPMPEVADAAATNAEAVFFQAIDYLRNMATSEDNQHESTQFWPPLPRDEDNEGEER